MLNAPSEERRRITFAPVTYSCVEPHECFTSIIIAYASTWLNGKLFDASHTRPWNATRMETYHRHTSSYSNKSIIDHIPGIKMQSFQATSDISISEGNS